jgi:2-(1,2-epoxy-1,2-dihydrophenyl)acetyl-CoA isomerase
MPAVQRTVRMLWRAPRPLIAAYNGSATAGGLDFGLACDVRVASSTARFAESYVNLGMIPVAGGAFLLPLLIGLPAATRVMASGAFFDAERALQLGMVQEVTPPDEVVPRAHALAAELASGPVETFAQMKLVARRTTSEALDIALQDSLDANIALIARPQVRERILAVMQRYSLARTTS